MKYKYLSLLVLSLSIISLGGCGETTTSLTSLKDNTTKSDTSFDIGITSSTSINQEFDFSAPSDEIGQIYDDDSGVFYEIFVNSFCDSNGDGIGDLNGVTSKLDYLDDLGISGIWLMPISPSPSYHKYDVTDYKDIDKNYGTMEDFENLLVEAHKRDIKVIIDMVLNHTSVSHPWFTYSYQQAITGSGQYKDYYNWSTTNKDGYNKYGNLYYESRFDTSMPDLNLDNEYVREEIKDILKFWLEKGVDGFRLDAVIYYYFGNDSKNIEFLTFLKDYCKSINQDTYIVGEAWTNNNAIQNYYNSGNSYFAFGFSDSDQLGYKYAVNVRNGKNLSKNLAEFTNAVRKNGNGANPAFFISNHDQDRWARSFIGTYANQSVKATASLLLLSPGNPYLYYGEEIGLNGSRGGENTDANRRLHMIWDSISHEGETNDPQGSNFDESLQPKDGVNQQIVDKTSLLYHYLKVINLRNKYANLFLNGNVSNIELPNNVNTCLKYSDDTDTIYCLSNTCEYKATIDLTLISNDVKIQDEVRIINETSYIEDNKLILMPFASVILK